MKIERINDEKVKFTFNIIDLKERDINLRDLTRGGPKTYRLFEDMKKAAYETCGFELGDLPVMMETMAFGQNQVIIIVTKAPVAAAGSCPHAQSAPHAAEPFAQRPPAQETAAIAVFSFEDLDTVAAVCKRVFELYPAHVLFSKTSLYKKEGRFFLLAEIDEPGIMSKVSTILSEYGDRHTATYLSKHYLSEHGELFFADRAVETLALRL